MHDQSKVDNDPLIKELRRQEKAFVKEIDDLRKELDIKVSHVGIIRSNIPLRMMQILGLGSEKGKTNE